MKNRSNIPSPDNRRAVHGKKTKPNLIGYAAGIAVMVILYWLIGKFDGSNEKPAYQRNDESKETAEVAGSTLDFTEPQYGIEMVHAQGGSFLMGCTPEQGEDCYEYEDTARLVTLSDFYIGKYEVTQAQWEAVMSGNPSNFKGDDLPVENVSWNEIQEFIGKLNQSTGREYRLPTEAEWEYAARGGRRNRAYKYSGSNNVGEVAWFEGNSEKTTHPVGTKKANELGLHDMSGNVWEWVSDWYGDYDNDQRKDPGGPDQGTSRVIRGGGWGSYARGVRVSNFYNNNPDNRYNILGFRLAMNGN